MLNFELKERTWLPAPVPGGCLRSALIVGVSVFLTLLSVVEGVAQAPGPLPRNQPGTGGNQVPPAPGPGKYRAPLGSDILTNREKALEWGELVRTKIAPTMHLVETEHFLIFSTWNRSNDQALRNVCEDMYQKLAAQFRVVPSESVWVGKCPIYIFWKAVDYLQFSTDIDKSLERREDLQHAAGYHSSRGNFSYIVLNGAEKLGKDRERAIQQFYGLLVHEGTHAFMNRYISARRLPTWVEEGFADYMAATLVPQSGANRKHVVETRRALDRGGDLFEILDRKTLSSAEYGVAQSLVRHLISVNPVAFHRFVVLLKQGKSENEALTEAYRANRQDLIRHWAAANRNR